MTVPPDADARLIRLAVRAGPLLFGQTGWPDRLAEALGIGRRTVAYWVQRGRGEPREDARGRLVEACRGAIERKLEEVAAIQRFRAALEAHPAVADVDLLSESRPSWDEADAREPVGGANHQRGDMHWTRRLPPEKRANLGRRMRKGRPGAGGA